MLSRAALFFDGGTNLLGMLSRIATQSRSNQRLGKLDSLLSQVQHVGKNEGLRNAGRRPGAISDG